MVKGVSHTERSYEIQNLSCGQRLHIKFNRLSARTENALQSLIPTEKRNVERISFQVFPEGRDL